MLGIKKVLPMTPMAAFNMLEQTEMCWVIVPYNSDEDEIEESHKFVSAVGQYFHERCGVSSLDMAYPGNARTFGNVVDDYPMLLVR